MKTLIENTCAYFAIEKEDFFLLRNRSCCDARKLVQLILFEQGTRITELAMMFDCHHTTIIHAVRQAKAYLEVDQYFAAAYKKIKEQQETLEKLIQEPFSKKSLSFYEIKALIESAYKAGQAQDEIRKERLVRLYE